MVRPGQQSHLTIQKGLDPEGLLKRITSAWRALKPFIPFPGFDDAVQEQLVKTLIYSPAFVAFGMDDAGVPFPLEPGELAPLVLAPFAAPAATLLSFGIVPAGERWLIDDFVFVYTTLPGGSPRRIKMTAVDPTAVTFGKLARSEATQGGGSVVSYNAATGPASAPATGLAGLENLIRVGNGFTAYAGQLVFFPVEGFIGTDSFTLSRATIRRFKVAP